MRITLLAETSENAWGSIRTAGLAVPTSDPRGLDPLRHPVGGGQVSLTCAGRVAPPFLAVSYVVLALGCASRASLFLAFR